MTALYQLVADYRDAAQLLADIEADDQTVADTLEAMAGDVEVKAVNVAMMARNLETTAEAIREAEKAMATRRKSIEARAENLRRYLQGAMEAIGIQKIECPQFALSIKTNPPSVDVFDEKQIPAAFMRQPETPPPAPDKVAIKAAIKAGQEIPGARLTQSKALCIK